MHWLQALLQLLPLLLQNNRRRSKQLPLVQYLQWQMVPSASPLNSKQQFPVVRHKLQA